MIEMGTTNNQKHHDIASIMDGFEYRHNNTKKFATSIGILEISYISRAKAIKEDPNYEIFGDIKSDCQAENLDYYFTANLINPKTDRIKFSCHGIDAQEAVLKIYEKDAASRMNDDYFIKL